MKKYLSIFTLLIFLFTLLGEAYSLAPISPWARENNAQEESIEAIYDIFIKNGGEPGELRDAISDTHPLKKFLDKTEEIFRRHVREKRGLIEELSKESIHKGQMLEHEYIKKLERDFIEEIVKILDGKIQDVSAFSLSLEEYIALWTIVLDRLSLRQEDDPLFDYCSPERRKLSGVFAIAHALSLSDLKDFKRCVSCFYFDDLFLPKDIMENVAFIDNLERVCDEIYDGVNELNNRVPKKADERESFLGELNDNIAFGFMRIVDAIREARVGVETLEPEQEERGQVTYNWGPVDYERGYTQETNLLYEKYSPQGKTDTGRPIVFFTGFNVTPANREEKEEIAEKLRRLTGAYFTEAWLNKLRNSDYMGSFPYELAQATGRTVYVMHQPSASKKLSQYKGCYNDETNELLVRASLEVAPYGYDMMCHSWGAATIPYIKKPGREDKIRILAIMDPITNYKDASIEKGKNKELKLLWLFSWRKIYEFIYKFLKSLEEDWPEVHNVLKKIVVPFLPVADSYFHDPINEETNVPQWGIGRSFNVAQSLPAIIDWDLKDVRDMVGSDTLIVVAKQSKLFSPD